MTDENSPNSNDDSDMDNESFGFEEKPEDTVNVRVESETHFGVERKSGGNFENECEKIIKFAGFTTQREVKVSYDDDSSDHYKIDVLAKYQNLTIFLEAKDYEEVKVSPKILFTLIGQVNHYRSEHPNENVIGILATSAKNIDGTNDGISRRLEAEGCYLWDGFKIIEFKNQWEKFRDGELFQEYFFNEIEYFKSKVEEKEDIDPKKGEPRFFCRLGFYSIPKLHYIGNLFHVNSILADLENQLDGTSLMLIRTRYDQFNDIANQPRFHFYCDFELSKTHDQIRKHGLKNKGSWYNRNPLSSPEIMRADFIRACKKSLDKTYGIEKEFHLTYPITVLATRTDILGSFVKHVF